MTTGIPSSAGGWGAILYSLKMARRAGGLLAILRALTSKNTCKTCALGMGGQSGGLRNEKGHFPEVCNKSFQAQAADMQGAIPHDFFDRYDVPTLRTWSPRQLELSGRLTRPLLCENHRYRPISWEKALNLLAAKLKSAAPERAFFYASGRSSNEAGFLLQLFARIFGTNNVSNCSYYCHQASGVGLTQTLGTGTATIQLEDLDHADLLFLIGANPSSNHPRFMTLLMQIRRRGGKVIVVNPARERGLEKFSVPSDLRSLISSSEIASSYIQPHIGGDIALLKGISKALLRNSESNPGIISTSFIQSSTEHFEDYKRDIEQTPWSRLEAESGLTQAVME
ncbi:MAG: molybdopterin-dependent oxidoreductase, partial [Nitrospinales bacterium]